jgi:glycerol-3-phosphate dehydrogenase
LLKEVNRVFENVQWTRKDICGSFAGLRSMCKSDENSPSSVSREWSLEKPAPGLLLPIGGKLTAARADAQVIVDEACNILGKDFADLHLTETTPMPWSPGKEYEEWKAQIADEAVTLGMDYTMAAWAIFRYGTSLDTVLQPLRENRKLSEPICDGLPFFKGELLHCAEHEMVVHMEDLIRRRIPLTLLSSITKGTLCSIAEMVAPILGWSPDDTIREIDLNL